MQRSKVSIFFMLLLLRFVNTGTLSEYLDRTYFASAHPLLGDHIFPSPISPRAKCERGARSPLAPTVPFSGTKDKQDAEETRGNSMVFKMLFESQRIIEDTHNREVSNRSLVVLCFLAEKNKSVSMK